MRRDASLFRRVESTWEYDENRPYREEPVAQAGQASGPGARREAAGPNQAKSQEARRPEVRLP